MALMACAYRARAWRGDELVADSTAAIRDEGADRAPILWFPVADVRVDLLDDCGDALRGVPANSTATSPSTPSASGSAWSTASIRDLPIDPRRAVPELG